MKRYELIDHTADFGLKIFGRDLKELFSNAAYGMFDIMAELNNVKPVRSFSVNIDLETPDIEELLLSWLKEILFIYSTKYFIFCRFDIEKITGRSIASKCYGEPADKKRHIFKREIKAVTSHQFYVKKEKDSWAAQVIFDT